MKQSVSELKISNIEFEKIEKAWMEKVTKEITKKFGKEMKEKNYSISTLMKDINFELQLVDFTTEKVQDFTIYMEEVIRTKLSKYKGNSENVSPRSIKNINSEKNLHSDEKEIISPKLANANYKDYKDNKGNKEIANESLEVVPKEKRVSSVKINKNETIKEHTKEIKEDKVNTEIKQKQIINLTKQDQEKIENYENQYKKKNVLLAQLKEKENDNWALIAQLNSNDYQEEQEEKLNQEKKLQKQIRDYLDEQLNTKLTQKMKLKENDDFFFRQQKEMLKHEEEIEMCKNILLKEKLDNVKEAIKEMNKSKLKFIILYSFF